MPRFREAERAVYYPRIAECCGVPLRRITELVRPKPGAKTVAFYSFGAAIFGGGYYDTQDLYNAMKPECMLAFEMNGRPLPLVCGAPLRLRVEKPARLEDGEMDRAHRIHRVRKADW